MDWRGRPVRRADDTMTASLPNLASVPTRPHNLFSLARARLLGGCGKKPADRRGVTASDVSELVDSRNESLLELASERVGRLQPVEQVWPQRLIGLTSRADAPQPPVPPLPLPTAVTVPAPASVPVPPAGSSRTQRQLTRPVIMTLASISSLPADRTDHFPLLEDDLLEDPMYAGMDNSAGSYSTDTSSGSSNSSSSSSSSLLAECPVSPAGSPGRCGDGVWPPEVVDKSVGVRVAGQSTERPEVGLRVPVIGRPLADAEAWRPAKKAMSTLSLFPGSMLRRLAGRRQTAGVGLHRPASKRLDSGLVFSILPAFVAAPLVANESATPSGLERTQRRLSADDSLFVPTLGPGLVSRHGNTARRSTSPSNRSRQLDTGTTTRDKVEEAPGRRDDESPINSPGLSRQARHQLPSRQADVSKAKQLSPDGGLKSRGATTRKSPTGKTSGHSSTGRPKETASTSASVLVKRTNGKRTLRPSHAKGRARPVVGAPVGQQTRRSAGPEKPEKPETVAARDRTCVGEGNDGKSAAAARLEARQSEEEAVDGPESPLPPPAGNMHNYMLTQKQTLHRMVHVGWRPCPLASQKPGASGSGSCSCSGCSCNCGCSCSCGCKNDGDGDGDGNGDGDGGSTARQTNSSSSCVCSASQETENPSTRQYCSLQRRSGVSHPCGCSHCRARRRAEIDDDADADADAEAEAEAEAKSKVRQTDANKKETSGRTAAALIRRPYMLRVCECASDYTDLTATATATATATVKVKTTAAMSKKEEDEEEAANLPATSMWRSIRPFTSIKRASSTSDRRVCPQCGCDCGGCCCCAHQHQHQHHHHHHQPQQHHQQQQQQQQYHRHRPQHKNSHRQNEPETDKCTCCCGCCRCGRCDCDEFEPGSCCESNRRRWTAEADVSCSGSLSTLAQCTCCPANSCTNSSCTSLLFSARLVDCDCTFCSTVSGGESAPPTTAAETDWRQPASEGRPKNDKPCDRHLPRTNNANTNTSNIKAHDSPNIDVNTDTVDSYNAKIINTNHKADTNNTNIDSKINTTNSNNPNTKTITAITNSITSSKHNDTNTPAKANLSSNSNLAKTRADINKNNQSENINSISATKQSINTIEARHSNDTHNHNNDDNEANNNYTNDSPSITNNKNASNINPIITTSNNNNNKDIAIKNNNITMTDDVTTATTTNTTATTANNNKSININNSNKKDKIEQSAECRSKRVSAPFDKADHLEVPASRTKICCNVKTDVEAGTRRLQVAAGHDTTDSSPVQPTSSIDKRRSSDGSPSNRTKPRLEATVECVVSQEPISAGQTTKQSIVDRTCSPTEGPAETISRQQTEPTNRQSGQESKQLDNQSSRVSRPVSSTMRQDDKLAASQSGKWDNSKKNIGPTTTLATTAATATTTAATPMTTMTQRLSTSYRADEDEASNTGSVERGESSRGTDPVGDSDRTKRVVVTGQTEPWAEKKREETVSPSGSRGSETEAAAAARGGERERVSKGGKCRTDDGEQGGRKEERIAEKGRNGAEAKWKGAVGGGEKKEAPQSVLVRVEESKESEFVDEAMRAKTSLPRGRLKGTRASHQTDVEPASGCDARDGRSSNAGQAEEATSRPARELTKRRALTSEERVDDACCCSDISIVATPADRPETEIAQSEPVPMESGGVGEFVRRGREIGASKRSPRASAFKTNADSGHRDSEAPKADGDGDGRTSESVRRGGKESAREWKGRRRDDASSGGDEAEEARQSVESRLKRANRPNEPVVTAEPAKVAEPTECQPRNAASLSLLLRLHGLARPSGGRGRCRGRGCGRPGPAEAEAVEAVGGSERRSRRDCRPAGLRSANNLSISSEALHLLAGRGRLSPRQSHRAPLYHNFPPLADRVQKWEEWLEVHRPAGVGDLLLLARTRSRSEGGSPSTGSPSHRPAGQLVPAAGVTHIRCSPRPDEATLLTSQPRPRPPPLRPSGAYCETAASMRQRRADLLRPSPSPSHSPSPSPNHSPNLSPSPSRSASACGSDEASAGLAHLFDGLASLCRPPFGPAPSAGQSGDVNRFYRPFGRVDAEPRLESQTPIVGQAEPVCRNCGRPHPANFCNQPTIGFGHGGHGGGGGGGGGVGVGAGDGMMMYRLQQTSPFQSVGPGRPVPHVWPTNGHFKPPPMLETMYCLNAPFTPSLQPPQLVPGANDAFPMLFPSGLPFHQHPRNPVAVGVGVGVGVALPSTTHSTTGQTRDHDEAKRRLGRCRGDVTDEAGHPLRYASEHA